MLTEQVFIGSVFVAGLLSFFSPCILPLLPVYMAYLGGAAPGNGRRTFRLGKLRIHPSLIVRTLFFSFGASFVFVLLGFGAGALGSVINAAWFMTVCGIAVIIFGVFQTGIVKLPLLQREVKWTMDWNGKKGIAASFLLGFTFSFGWTPCIGPILAAVLSLSASEGSSLQGGGFMVVYALGMALPFLVLAVCSDLLIGRLRGINKYMNALKIASGVLLIAMGALLMTGKLDILATAL